MPDTGAPWNIPYVAGTDLVSDWPTDSLALANAIDGGLDTLRALGIGSNVVQTVKTDQFSTSSTSFVSVTGLSVTITPSTSTSKILILGLVNLGASVAGHIRISGGNATTFVGDAASNRVRAMATIGVQQVDFRVDNFMTAATIAYLDSPATTSPVTYQVEARLGTGTNISINSSYLDADNANHARGASSIIAIEVAA